MKTTAYVLLIVLLTGTKSIAQTDKPGPHGGKVKGAGSAYKIEMLYSRGNFYAFLLDGNSKPLGNKGITCSLHVCFNTCDNTDHELKPFSADGFSAESVLVKDFYSCTLIFLVNGKKYSAEFFNEGNENGDVKNE